MSLNRLARTGDRVMLLEDPWEGVSGRVRKAYKNGNISVVISRSDVPAKAKPLIIAPDGFVHWIAIPGEFEIYDETKGVF